MPIRLSRGLIAVGGVILKNGVALFDGTGVPVDGVTGAGVAGPGSVYFRTNGDQYTNTGTKASPTWTATVNAVSAASSSPSPSKSPSASASPS
jgi:hypothetical protein